MSRSSLASLVSIGYRLNAVKHYRPLPPLRKITADSRAATVASGCLFEHRLQSILDSCAQSRNNISVMGIDIDRFDVVESELGPAAGDALLKKVRELLRHHTEDVVTVGLIRPARFIAVWSGTSRQSVAAIASALHRHAQEASLEWDDQSVQIGISIGVVYASHGCGVAPALLDMVDTVCRQAKRSRFEPDVCFCQLDASSDTCHQADRRGAIGVMQTLQQRRFQLYAQPIVSLASGLETGERYELLFRPLDAHGVPSSPESFIKVAEEHGLMSLVDRYVIRAAFEWIAELRAQAPICSCRSISINVSGPSLTQPGFAAYVRAQASALSLSTEQICLEVTEGQPIQDMDVAASTMAELKALGFRFALDDFGKGAASFTYMKSLPFDYLKIDGDFVKDMLTNAFDSAVVQAAICASQQRGMQIVAECVESLDVADRLHCMGVNFIQGYLVGKPRAVMQCRKTAVDDPLVME